MAVMGNSSAFIITTNTLHLPKLQFLLLLFFLLTPSATPLNFSFSSFNGNNLATITKEGDAFFDTKILGLTDSSTDGENSMGRATYRQPFLHRENATGKLADFTTSFNFAIDSNNNSKYGDGLVFFVAPNDSSLNNVLGSGSSLGLPVDSKTPNVVGPRNQYPFVAVEFDIYQNTHEIVDDPAHEHVGINVNSLKSIITKNWTAGILNGTKNSATVSYNSTTKNLSIAFTTFVDGVQVIHYLDYMVNLKDYLPDWVVVGFSASTGNYVALFKIFSWNFNSTSLVDCHEVDVATKSGNDNRIGLIIGKRDAGESSDENPMVNELIDEEFEKRVGPRKFLYSELAHATSNFGVGENLGEGGFGGVYKGFLQDLKSFVAVKRISMESKQGLKEYASEVKIISQLRHRNLVKLIGWCHERKFILVYEFMPNGSLDAHLFKEQSFLTWDARYKIALGLASGLLYLHEGWEQCVLHRDIKSSNVMLDSNFNAKLGDFGLARLVDHGQEPETTALAGTMGYMAPDYLNTGKASKESDVYSLGVVALEIACGRKAIDPKFGTCKINMVEWIWELHGEGRAIEAVDPKLCGDFDEEQMECLIIVGLWCAHPDYNMRPSIQQAIQMLNFEIPLPPLPSKMPAATYFTAPKSLSMLSRDTSGSQGGQTGYGHNTYCQNVAFLFYEKIHLNVEGCQRCRWLLPLSLCFTK
ncbi:L-type lectin-domain containing receptor kinase IX.1-like [Prunus avium]|uniref:L-type lectin-domain containing receptor kinase IX.1-like n=1 Tax=Prunus avium TaxID=42229 RepID=A0A6P5RAH7_PRUAV|nr:L-type lectin-domain containing receptor kinase IX.1-like [Prunus avium]